MEEKMMPEKNKKLLRQLFFTTLYISTFTFGGGYVIVTLMKKKFVDEFHWIDEQEMLDLVAIAQSAPGPIAVNGAIVAGYKLAGMWGILTATLATVLPPFVIISVVSVFYTAFRDNRLISQMLEGMQAGVGAVIASVVFDMAQNIFGSHQKSSVVIMFGAFVFVRFFKMNVVFVILACGLMGIVRTWYLGKR